jgi:hypothetical protein
LQLVESAPEVIERLRDPYAHHGEHRAFLTDAADREFRTLWWVAVTLGLDPAGLPAYRVNGEVRGLSLRTSPLHVSWLCEDVAARLPDDDLEIWRTLWDARSASISCSPEVASVMLAVHEAAQVDAFAEFRAADSA